LVLSIQFAYALLLVFFQTWREAGKVYSHPNLLGGDSL
jgi:Na+/glutamate symporter